MLARKFRSDCTFLCFKNISHSVCFVKRFFPNWMSDHLIFSHILIISILISISINTGGFWRWPINKWIYKSQLSWISATFKNVSLKLTWYSFLPFLLGQLIVNWNANPNVYKLPLTFDIAFNCALLILYKKQNTIPPGGYHVERLFE